VTEWLLPGLECPCCGTVTFAAAPTGGASGAVSYGPVLNAAAVLLSCYGNVPPERAAQLIGMLLGKEVSADWVDKAAARVSAQLGKAGFDEAILAALAAGDVLAADETPVNLLDGTARPAPAAGGAPEAGKGAGEGPGGEAGKAAAGAPHPADPGRRPRLPGVRAVELDQQHAVPGVSRVLGRHVLEVGVDHRRGHPADEPAADDAVLDPPLVLGLGPGPVLVGLPVADVDVGGTALPALGRLPQVQVGQVQPAELPDPGIFSRGTKRA
jgi:hypothetical protein